MCYVAITGFSQANSGLRIPQVASTSIEILKTPYHAPRANAICERFLRSVRQECLDHLLILHERQLQRILNGYVAYFNQARPHQGIQQQIPDSSGSSRATAQAGIKVIAMPILPDCTMTTERWLSEETSAPTLPE